MICQTCKAEGQKSTISVGCGMTTAMGYAPFYDEDGVLHIHDPNVTTRDYTCSRGHSWSASTTSKCPACSWPENEKEKS